MSARSVDAVLTANTKFSPALARVHVREAVEFLALCERTGQPLLDPCGPRGDLYFLLKTMVAPEGVRHLV